MKKTVVVFAAAVAICVACAPLPKKPAAPVSTGAAPPKQQQELQAHHSAILNPGQPTQGVDVSFAGIEKAGQTVAEVYAGKDALAGTAVTVRGRVVKFSARIMGKNWAHVQDGTGSAGTNDLTVTTKDAARVGDTVLVSGKVSLDKDFGSGYKYGLIIEDGSVVVEQ